jgi:RNA polymerase sigma factor (sigma-70 family)
MDAQPSPAAEPEQDADPQALARAIASNRTYLMFVASKFKGTHSLPERVSDLAHQALLEALGAVRAGDGGRLAFPSEKKLRAWLRTILKRTYHDMLRRHRAKKRTPRILPPRPVPPSPSSQAARNENAQRLAEARAALDPVDRELIDWRVIDGLTFEEIGRRRGFSTSYARRACEQALRKLAALYDGGPCPTPP